MRKSIDFLVTSSLSGREILSRSLDQADGRHSPTPELVEALMLAEQFQLKTIKDAIDHELYMSLKDIPHIPDVVKN